MALMAARGRFLATLDTNLDTDHGTEDIGAFGATPSGKAEANDNDILPSITNSDCSGSP